MSASAVLVIELVVVVGGVVALALWLRRRYGRPWSIWWWGALAFVASQVVRLPLLAVLPAVAGPALLRLGVLELAVAGVAVLTSGLFEEGTRWLVLRFGARDARRWTDGVVFGAGHGGIEAVLLIGASVATGLVLLANGDALLEVVPAPAAEALAAQIEAVRAVTVGQAALAVWERVLAITLHVALALLVVRAVRERAPRFLLAAMAFHVLFNAVALVVLTSYGALAAELALTVVTAAAVVIIVRERRRDAMIFPAAVFPAATSPAATSPAAPGAPDGADPGLSSADVPDEGP